MWHRGMLETESCILDCYDRFAAEIVTNNEIRVRSGAGMLQGRFFCIEPAESDTVFIANGNQGENRIDLIAVRWTVDTMANTQEAALSVIQGAPMAGTPSMPEVIAGDLDAGDLTADYPLYKVIIEGLTIARLDPLFSAGWILTDETITAFKNAGISLGGE